MYLGGGDARANFPNIFSIQSKNERLRTFRAKDIKNFLKKLTYVTVSGLKSKVINFDLRPLTVTYKNQVFN